MDEMDMRGRVWRRQLMGTDKQVEHKRAIFYRFVQRRDDVTDDIVAIIERDLPRTYPKNAWAKEHSAQIRSLLVAYAAVHRGDSYLQGFNYAMTIIYRVFVGTDHASADTWWCFARYVGLIRPLVPDFNVTWFHWCRRNWMRELFERLRRKRPHLHSILEQNADTFSTLITCKWFMLWFAQQIPFNDILALWDVIIQHPPQHLLKLYTALTYIILVEAAPSITYKWASDPTGLVHSFLSFRVNGIQHILQQLKQFL